MNTNEIATLIQGMNKYRREHFQMEIRTSVDSVRKGYAETVYLEWTTNGSQFSAASFSPEEARLLHDLLGQYLLTGTTKAGNTAP